MSEILNRLLRLKYFQRFFTAQVHVTISTRISQDVFIAIISQNAPNVLSGFNVDKIIAFSFKIPICSFDFYKVLLCGGYIFLWGRFIPKVNTKLKFSLDWLQLEFDCFFITFKLLNIYPVVISMLKPLNLTPYWNTLAYQRNAFF